MLERQINIFRSMNIISKEEGSIIVVVLWIEM